MGWNGLMCCWGGVGVVVVLVGWGGVLGCICVGVCVVGLQLTKMIDSAKTRFTAPALCCGGCEPKEYAPPAPLDNPLKSARA